MNRRKLINFMIAVMITLTAVAFALFGDGIFRTMFGLTLAFVLPGYAVMAAWFPRRLTRFPGNVLFILMLSLCLTSLGGIVLHETRWGLTTQSWALLLGGWTLANLVVSLRHREIFFMPLGDKTTAVKLPLYQTVLILAAVGISVGALYYSRETASQQNRSDLTQLWMSQTDAANTIHVGVKNNDLDPLDYRIVIRDGETVTQDTFHLGTDEAWERDVQVAKGAARPVNVYLSRLDQPHLVYRTTSLWLPDTE